MKLIGKGNSYGHPTLYVKNWQNSFKDLNSILFYVDT